jgi:NDP-sugar pyrophosphorylase family protein
MIKKAVVLAAGSSSRFWPLNGRHKSLIHIMGKPLIFYTLKGLERSGISEAIIVQDKNRDIERGLREESFGMKLTYAVSPESKGMGDALSHVRNQLKERFLLVNAERVDIDEILKEAAVPVGADENKALLFGQKTSRPQLFGMMKLEGKRVLDIIEKPRKGTEPSDIRVVGVYVLEPDFFETYQKVKRHVYDFEEALSEYASRARLEAFIIKRPVLHLKYPWNLFSAEKYLFDRFLKEATDESSFVSDRAVVEGKVFIGAGSKIYENAVIKGPCYIGPNCLIGNNALVRGYTNLEGRVMVGANSEVPRSIFQEDVHVHANFIGDSVLGRGCRVGAGSVTANRRIDRAEIRPFVKNSKRQSGLTSLGCIMGEGVKTGINCCLMPGIMIGSRSTIGPNSLVMDNLEEDTLFYSVFKEVKKHSTHDKN